jgi:hypothetical protein
LPRSQPQQQQQQRGLIVLSGNTDGGSSGSDVGQEEVIEESSEEDAAAAAPPSGPMQGRGVEPKLFVLGNGSGSPCLDLSRVPAALADATVGVDLLVSLVVGFAWELI